MAVLKALRDAGRNGALRNGVTNVTAKRPDTDKNIITTTVSVEREKLGKGSVSPDLGTIIKQKGWA
jgi:hypothetical protein